jgi:hypothetical protein
MGGVLYDAYYNAFGKHVGRKNMDIIWMKMAHAPLVKGTGPANIIEIVNNGMRLPHND